LAGRDGDRPGGLHPHQARDGLHRLSRLPSVSPPAVPINRRPPDAKDASAAVPKRVLRSTGQCIGWVSLPVVSPRRRDQIGHRGSQVSPGLVGWVPEGRSGGISRCCRASKASIVRWLWCSAAWRSGIGSSQDQSPRARAVGTHKWSDVLVRRRIRCGPRRERAREPGPRTSVARGRRRVREVRHRSPSHDCSPEPRRA